jgi:aspartyl/glutamyl-tRNA(Asn/Gln) amidotransferase C subunit
MNQEEVKHLAKLARIELSEKEVESFTKEMSAILAYVSTVQDIVGEDSTANPQVGKRHNVFRKDVVTNEPDQYTNDIMAEMPKTEGRFMVVKKILNTDN